MKKIFKLLILTVLSATLWLPLEGFNNPAHATRRPRLSFKPIRMGKRVYLINTRVDKAGCDSKGGFWYGKVCNGCPVGKHYNEDISDCQCPTGFLDNGPNYSCRCPANSSVVYRAKGAACVAANESPKVEEKLQADPNKGDCPANQVCTNLVPLSPIVLETLKVRAK